MSRIQVLSTSLNDKYFPFEWYNLATENHFWFEWRFQILLQLFQETGISLTIPLKGMDVGCGNGIILRQIEHSTNWRVDGVDLSKKSLVLANVTRGELFLYNIHDRYHDFREHYDFIILFDVLEHIKNTQLFLESLLFHLKPSGWLFINVPALTLLFSNYDRAAQHIRRYDKKKMQRELASNNIKVYGMRYWGLSLIPLLMMRKIILTSNLDNSMIIEKGFKVPNNWINKWLLQIMRIEISLIKKPLLGTSLMTAAIKSSNVTISSPRTDEELG